MFLNLKRTVIALVMILSNYNIHAQFFDTHDLYASGGVLLGNYLGMAGSINYISHEKYSLQLTYAGFVNEAKLPSDYDPAWFYIGQGLGQPRVQLNSIEVLVGRVVKIHSSGKIRLNLRGGFIYSTIIQPTNWQKTSYSPQYGNYDYEYKYHGKPGIVIKPEIEFPVFRFLGWGIAPYTIINTELVLWGVEFNYLLGLARKK